MYYRVKMYHLMHDIKISGRIINIKIVLLSEREFFLRINILIKLIFYSLHAKSKRKIVTKNPTT